MIALIPIAILAVAYRIKMRLFTKAEVALFLVFVVNCVMIELQIAICDKRAFPEMRYWVQSGILLFGWAVWGVLKASAAMSKKCRLLKYALPAAVGGLAITEMVMLAKPHIPVSRRYAYLRAVDWAAEKIRADWKGPSMDEGIKYFNGEYRQSNRPVVRCHTARLAYVLNGRNDSTVRFFADDLPDYICDEERKIDLGAKFLRGAEYELVDRLKIGGRCFALYKRVGREMSR